MTPSQLPPILSTRVAVSDVGCWLFTGTLTSIGYARVGWQGDRVMAHRLAYRTLVDPAFVLRPGGAHAGLQLDHLCSVRHCVNPDHLEPVTHAINVHRSALRRAVVHGTTNCWCAACRDEFRASRTVAA